MVGGLYMMGTIGAKRISVHHRAQQEGLKCAALMGRTQHPKNARQSACCNNQHTERSQSHPQELADYQGPNLETSKGATSEGSKVPCTSRFSLGLKEPAD
eukprot:14947866-Ditylum_brightwellii.AAC.1